MEDYAREAVALLKESNLKIASAESCTGGLLAKRITDISGSSAVFECGVVTYSNRMKTELLGVKSETTEKYGAVSEETVREMADGVRKISGADITVAISGIAGPSSDSTNKPVGLIWIAVNFQGKIYTKKLNNIFDTNVRENNRNSAADEALRLICGVIREELEK